MRDYKGNKYNALTMLNYAKAGGKGVGSIWRVRCDCGEIKELKARDVVNGRIGSCGKCEYSRRPRQKVSRKLAGPLGRDIARSHKAGIDWQLSAEEYQSIIQSPCLICTEVPGSHYHKSKLIGNNVSRINNGVGFTPENSIPLCDVCHRRKGSDNLQEYLDYIEKCYYSLTTF